MDNLQIKVTKGDLIWSYIAHFLNMAAGIIILPYVLIKLTAAEVGLYYVMITISSLIALLDFGFSPQFARNISYIYGGAQKLNQEGVSEEMKGIINYRLLATMIIVAKKVYRLLSFFLLVLMLSLGSLYIYHVTSGFVQIDNSLFIWIIFSFSAFFNMYFSYYNSLLTGSGLIKEQRISIVCSKILYIILCIFLITAGFGLLGLCLANLIAPFLARYISHVYFYSKELKAELKKHSITEEEKKDLFSIIWYNAKKLGITSVSAYGINKMGMFLAGLYLTLEEMSSYGLMVQLVGVIGSVSLMPFTVSIPLISAMQISKRNVDIMRRFAFSMNLYYLIFILSSLFLIFILPLLLHILGSNTSLPLWQITALYCLIMLLEHNHSAFATMIVTENSVPFVLPSVISGGFIVIFSFLILQYSEMGIGGLVIVQGVVQLAYNNWKWPKLILNKYNISYPSFVMLGFHQSSMCFTNFLNKLESKK